MIDQMGKKCFRNAFEKGFYSGFIRLSSLVSRYGTEEDQKFLKQIWLSNRLMLVVSELAEGLEAIRDGNLSCDPKSGGLGEEIVDAQIRLADLFFHAVPDVSNEKAIVDKMEYNESRPYQHGRSGL